MHWKWIRFGKHPYRHNGSTRSRSRKSWSLLTEEISIGNWESGGEIGWVVNDWHMTGDKCFLSWLAVNEVCEVWSSCYHWVCDISSQNITFYQPIATRSSREKAPKICIIHHTHNTLHYKHIVRDLKWSLRFLFQIANRQSNKNGFLNV